MNIRSKKKALRNIFGDHLIYLGKKNQKICVVSCDLKSATKTSGFFKIFPKSWKRKYLKNTIRDVEDRLEFAKKSTIYFEKRLEQLKWDLDRL